ncbi:Polyphosphate kinase [Methanimicrococcus stummii]|uniref:Polyphosphate kinase n=1 Tax=Methanimicrococcus stummii TaxID=3028294 RepID=A0AA96VGH6_9EURY|nr:polyphosphate kinase 1 [Methanimicrococcus sp. Es2]WNY27991.1 Polyphosphate kinase [Methanimicrococcus sp. Es2]
MSSDSLPLNGEKRVTVSDIPGPDELVVSSDPDLYIDRDFSWLYFNDRVMEEALDESNPLLERVRFLSIFASNLDEYYMVRIPTVNRTILEDSISPGSESHVYQEMQKIYAELPVMLGQMENCWINILMPELEKQNIRVLEYSELEEFQIEYVNKYFKKNIFPQLTPLAYDSSHPFPYIANQSVNLAVILSDTAYGKVFVRIKIPSNIKRLIQVPSKEDLKSGKVEDNMAAGKSGKFNFVWADDVIIANLDMVFPGQVIQEAHAFRITRDGDLGLDDDGDFNLMKSIEKKSGAKYFGNPLRMEINNGMSDYVLKILMENLKLRSTQVETLASPVGLSSISELCDVSRADLKYEPFTPNKKEYLKPSKKSSIFSKIKKKDVLVYRPYDSFESVIDFVQAASIDPDVVAIKITLYRVDKKSRIIQHLKEAADNGKQVAVLIELKARFDEENNVAKAKELEHSNIHVVYGVPNLKTHAKVCMVLRKEDDEIIPYVHMSTGNYNATTSRIYTDFEYFTADPDIGQDAVDLFNSLTGYSRKLNYRKLLVAPSAMRDELVSKIRREVKNHKAHGNGHILFKLNSLVDPECISELYKASIEGVQIDLQIRGISCVRPQIPGYSDNIHVTSIVGRFLEHTRVYYFHNNGDEELYLGSADLMQRNLDRRIEILFPVNADYLRKIKDVILEKHLHDNVKLRIGLPDGSFKKVARPEGEEPLDSQIWMTENQDKWD